MNVVRESLHSFKRGGIRKTLRVGKYRKFEKGEQIRILKNLWPDYDNNWELTNIPKFSHQDPSYREGQILTFDGKTFNPSFEPGTGGSVIPEKDVMDNLNSGFFERIYF